MIAWVFVTATEMTSADDSLYEGYIGNTEPRSPAEELKSFRLPPGFEIQLVVAEPQIYKPLNLSFDRRGRLWVSNTIEYPFAVEENGRKSRDRITILEDHDGDGRADRVKTFADDLVIPIGVVPIHGGAVVFSIPKIYKLLDHDGDDREDERVELYRGFGQVDTHGLVNAFTVGLDGWIYACHGFANRSHVTGTGDWSTDVVSGNTVRFRPDGTRLELHTHGQVNPFGLAFDSYGSLFSTDCHTRPIYQLIRGASYPRFGDPHDGLGFGPDVCAHEHSSTGISGIVYYDANQFPPEYKDVVFTGNPVTYRIECDRLERRGATYEVHHRPDLLTSDDEWFRPVDLELGPEGALYIADFYNRIIGHYEAPLTHPGRDRERGRIWRVIYRPNDAGRQHIDRQSTDVTKATIPDLIKTLGDPNLVMRKAAQLQLIEHHGAASTPELLRVTRRGIETGRSPLQVAHALWCLEHLGRLERELLRRASAHPDPRVRVHVLQILAARPALREGERALLLQGLSDDDGVVQNAAVQALTEHPRNDHARTLIDFIETVPVSDVILLHTTRVALREQLRLASSWATLAAGSLSADDTEAILDVIFGVHTPESAAYLLTHVSTAAAAGKLAPQREALYVPYLARYLEPNALPQLVAWINKQRGVDGDASAQLAIVGQAIRERELTASAEILQLVAPLASAALSSTDDTRISSGLTLTTNFRLTNLQDQVRRLARDRDRSDGVRAAAYETLFRFDTTAALPELESLLFDGSENDRLRERAVSLLGNLRQQTANKILARALSIVPLNLGKRIRDYLARSLEGGELLIAELVSGRASPQLLLTRGLQPQLERLGMKGLNDIIPPMLAELPDPIAEFQELVDSRRSSFGESKPDVVRGAEVFAKHCAPCHSIAGKGGRSAPQLDGVGIRGLDRLLEDILDPNRNIDQAFRASLVVLKSGVSYSGLARDDGGSVLTLVKADGKEERIPKSEIALREVLTTSPMPSNFVEVVTRDDFNHLLGYLLQQKAPPARR